MEVEMGSRAVGRSNHYRLLLWICGEDEDKEGAETVPLHQWNVPSTLGPVQHETTVPFPPFRTFHLCCFLHREILVVLNECMR